MIKKRTPKREPGQGLVEFALILPILLLVLVGIAGFARLFAIYSNLFNAAREGTRYGMVNAEDMAGILSAAQAKIAEADAEKAIAEKFNEAAAMMSPGAMEIYRLNVLERIGREEGSQIVIYGLNGPDSDMDKMLSASVAASKLQK